MKTFKQNFEVRIGYDQSAGLFWKGSYVGKCSAPKYEPGNLSVQAGEFLSLCGASEKQFVKNAINKAFNRSTN